MIASVRGPVQAIGNDWVVIETGGLGVRVFVPSTVLEALEGPGQIVFLYTHFHIRETEWALFGFNSQEELNLFELLMTTNGVGPKVALSILSTLSPDVLRRAVANEQPEVLDRVPGIGRKMAERIVFHLKDRMGPLTAAGVAAGISDVDAETIAALTALGYSIVEAQSALQAIGRAKPGETIEDRVLQALTYLAPR